jgi:hypothetical protein
MIGTNGQSENDSRYFEICDKNFPNIPLLQYKNIFGESYTSPALGIYAAITCLKNGNVPEHLLLNKKTGTGHCGLAPKSLKKILFYNNFEGKNHSLILLSKC